MADLSLLARLGLDNQGYMQGLSGAQSQTRAFAGVVRREFQALRGFAQSTSGLLASVGAGYTVASQLVKSANLDQTLIQVGQTADASRQQVMALRGELFRLGKSSGESVETLAGGFNSLVQSGLDWNSSLASLDAVNTAVGVTRINADIAASALQSMAANFEFDLSKPGQALALLDKMRVASKLGNAEMENLAGIFPRFAQNAKGAGMSVDQSLSYVEGLSLLERQPERLSTLADSGLRLFTNAQYKQAFSKRTGISFYNADNTRRDPLAVLSEFRSKFQALGSDRARDTFLGKATQGLDMDLAKMLRIVASGAEEPGKEGLLAKISDSFTKSIAGSGGTLTKELPDAMNNAISQAGVLRNTLREAADGFAKPINAALTQSIKYLTGKKQDGGLELSGGELMAGGAAALLGGYVGGRLLKNGLGRLLGGSASLGSGIAIGSALEKVGAATPVFVVGAAPGLFSGTGSGTDLVSQVAEIGAVRAAAAGAPVSALLGSGAAGVATVGAGVTAAGVGGWYAGKGLYNLTNMTEAGRRQNDEQGRGWAQVLAFFGNDTAEEALALRGRERGALFANVRGKVSSMSDISAANIGDAVSKSIAGELQRRPMKGELDVRVTDARTTVTSRGGDFANVRSTTRTVRGNTGRSMGDRQ